MIHMSRCLICVYMCCTESEVDDLSLKWSDEMRVEEFVQRIGKQLKLDVSCLLDV